MSKAEVKPFKLGEPLASDDVGNPEPSTLEISRKACVETRRKVCIRCLGDIPSDRNSKYCSVKCRQRTADDKYRVKHGKTQLFGVGSGGNQRGEKNNQWTGKSGAGGCLRAMRALPNICNRCSSTSNLVAHHVDHDRTNNDISNFEILCSRCHRKHHETRDSFGRYTKG
jgi:predicted nucleic acid-binding Zn ribbon protein